MNILSVDGELIPTPQLLAQVSFANLKMAIHRILKEHEEEGLTDFEIGILLGVFNGKSEEIQICRLVLGMLDAKGLIKHNGKSGKWKAA